MRREHLQWMEMSFKIYQKIQSGKFFKEIHPANKKR